MAKLTAEERFWLKVVRTGTCWLWTGAMSSGGYGNFHAGSHNTRAHRFAYQLLVGSIPSGLTLDHLCRIPACVNPLHLEPVTMAENLRRAAAAITHCPAGHEYTPESAWRSGDGHRQCRVCDRDRKRAKRGYLGHVRGGTHCHHDHEYTPENTHINKQGKRVCRTCAREYQRRHRAAA